MGSSLPAALDYLIANTRALPIVANARPKVIVSDGIAPAPASAMIAFGTNPDADSIELETTYTDESGTEDEVVTVPVFIGVHRAGGDNAQSKARAAACALFDAVRGLVIGDRTLGGAIRLGMPARLSTAVVDLVAEPEDSGGGRMCEIRFRLSWAHQL